MILKAINAILCQSSDGSGSSSCGEANHNSFYCAITRSWITSIRTYIRAVGVRVHAMAACIWYCFIILFIKYNWIFSQPEEGKKERENRARVAFRCFFVAVRSLKENNRQINKEINTADSAHRTHSLAHSQLHKFKERNLWLKKENLLCGRREDVSRLCSVLLSPLRRRKGYCCAFFLVVFGPTLGAHNYIVCFVRVLTHCGSLKLCSTRSALGAWLNGKLFARICHAQPFHLIICSSIDCIKSLQLQSAAIAQRLPSFIY